MRLSLGIDIRSWRFKLVPVAVAALWAGGLLYGCAADAPPLIVAGLAGTAVFAYRRDQKHRERLRVLEARNAELEQACRLAEARLQHQSRQLAEAHHELRTPLHGILGFTELLTQTPLAADQREKLQLIERSAFNLLNIVNTTLDRTKIEAGKSASQVYRLRPCLEDTVALLTPQAQVPILLRVESQVPEYLSGDPVRLQQVLTNLIGNAAKFTRSGCIVVRVRWAPQGPLLFSVSDTGPGLAQEDLDKLFVPFAAAKKNPSQGQRGTGLGLSIAKALVKNLGGRIGVASKPGKGTTFWFTHPLNSSGTDAPRPPSDHSVPSPSRSGAAASLPWPTLRDRVFLVADDNDINRKLFKAQLTQLGVQVSEAVDGLEALRQLQERPFDVVFLDLRMPGLNGVDLLRELLLGPPSPNHHTPFIAVTAHVLDEERLTLLHAGFAEVLLKPLQEEALFQILGRFFGFSPALTSSKTDTSTARNSPASALLERSGGNPVLAETLARKLIQELQAQSQNILKALTQGQRTQAREASHRINGSAAFCNLETIRTSAAGLEQVLIQDAPPDVLWRHFRQLDREIQDFLAEQDALLAALAKARKPLQCLG